MLDLPATDSTTVVLSTLQLRVKARSAIVIVELVPRTWPERLGLI